MKLTNKIKFSGAIAITLVTLSLSAQQPDAETSIPPELEELGPAYQRCIEQVMSSMDKAAVKRSKIAEQCKTQRDELIAVFPIEAQEFVGINMSRELEVILTALESSESMVVESLEDSADILDLEGDGQGASSNDG